MKDEQKHTELPWHYQERSDAYTHIIRTESDGFIVQLSQDSTGKSEAKARFIVTACNSYHTLKQQNEELQKEIENLKQEIRGLDLIIKQF